MSFLNWLAEVKWSWFHVKQWRAFVACYKKVATTYDLNVLSEEKKWVKGWMQKTLTNPKNKEEEIALWHAALSWIDTKMAWLSNDWNRVGKHADAACLYVEGAPRHLQRWLVPHLHAWSAIAWLSCTIKQEGATESRMRKVAFVRAHDAIWGSVQYPSMWFANDRVLLSTTVLKTASHPEIDVSYWKGVRDGMCKKSSAADCLSGTKNEKFFFS
jgi:hypothetical protein